MRYWINKKIYKPYTDLEIPCKKFFRAIETSDLRHILITDKLPTYEQFYLVGAFESIFDQYSKLMNCNAYKENINKTSQEIIQNANDNLLLIGYDLLLVHREEAFMFLKEVGIEINEFNAENVEMVKRKILSRINRKNIDNLRNKLLETKNDGQSFEDFVAQVEIGLERSIDVNGLTLKEWCAKVKSLDKKISEQRKQLERK